MMASDVNVDTLINQLRRETVKQRADQTRVYWPRLSRLLIEAADELERFQLGNYHRALARAESAEAHVMELQAALNAKPYGSDYDALELENRTLREELEKAQGELLSCNLDFVGLAERHDECKAELEKAHQERDTARKAIRMMAALTSSPEEQQK